MRFESGKHTLWCFSVCPPLIFFHSFHILHSQRLLASIRYFYLHSHLLLFASFALVNSGWTLADSPPTSWSSTHHPDILSFPWNWLSLVLSFHVLSFKLSSLLFIHHSLIWERESFFASFTGSSNYLLQLFLWDTSLLSPPPPLTFYKPPPSVPFLFLLNPT